MTVKSLELARRAARGAAAVAFLLTTSAVLAQDETPPTPDATETAPSADAAATDTAAPADAPAPAEAAAPAEVAPAPAESAAGETPAVIPVQTGEAETPAEGTRLETIEVTGSRLKRTDYETAQPVVTLTREDLERTGLTDISQILRQMTAAGNNSLTTQQGRMSTTLGETNLDLRNLGATHTLLLVNGRRWVTGLIPTQPSVSDYNTIPTAIIERIEVLKDGASAVYGSDAIGGVVNIITRKDFEGLGVQYQSGSYYEQGDGYNQQGSLSWGMTRPGRTAFVNVSYTEQGDAPTRNRPVTASSTPGTGFTRWSGVTTRGRYQFFPTQENATLYQCDNVQGGIAAGATGEPALRGTNAVPAGVVLCDLVRLPQGEVDSTTPAESDDYRKRDRNLDVYNKFLEGTLQEPNSRTAVYGQFTQDLGSLGISSLLDGISFSFDGLYNARKSTTVGQNVYIMGGSLAPSKGYLGGVSANNPFNPFGQDIGIDPSCQYQEDRTSCTGLTTGAGIWLIRQPPGNNGWNNHDEVATMRLGGALSGAFDLLSTPYSWTGGYIYSHNEIEDITPLFRFDREELALGGRTGDLTECSNTPGCVPLDVFHGEAGLTQAMVDWLYTDNWQRNNSGQQIGYFDLSGELPFARDLLAGSIAVATGIEVRYDEYHSRIDPAVQAGYTLLNTQQNTDGKTNAKEAYLELGLPLLKDLPFVTALDLDLAGRYSRYPGFGNVTTGKAGLRWQPADDLLLRATYSTGFRAPNIAELYAPAAQSYDPLSDPCASASPPGPGEDRNDTFTNCTTDGAIVGSQGNGTVQQPYDLWVGNADLDPERSRNLTYGLIYSPRWAQDLNFSVDYYKIKVDDYITVGTGQFFLDSCYSTPREDTTTPGAGPYCSNINRTNGVLQSIDTPYINLAKVETAGLDFGMDFVIPLDEDIGRIKMALEASYLIQYDQGLPPPGTVERTIGTNTGLFAGFPRWKAGSNLTWSRDLWNASWSTRLAYKMTEQCNDIYGDGNPDVAYSTLGLCTDVKYDADGNDVSENVLKTVLYHNVQIGRDLPWYNANITLGVNNVLDQDPPISYSMIGFYWYNYDPNHYEIPGRFGYLRASFSF